MHVILVGFEITIDQIRLGQGNQTFNHKSSVFLEFGLRECVTICHPGQVPRSGVLALLNLSFGECAKRNSTRRTAGFKTNWFFAF